MKNNSKILNIDSRDIAKKIHKNSVGFVVFSPPYWNLRNYGFDEQIGYKETYDDYLSSTKMCLLIYMKSYPMVDLWQLILVLLFKRRHEIHN